MRCALILCLLLLSSCSSSASNPPIVIAVPNNWHQLQLGSVNQNMAGFISDILYDLANQTHLSVKIIEANPTEYLSLLETKKVDAIITMTSEDISSEKTLSFSDPIFVTGTVIVAPINSTYTTANDLTYGRIGYSPEEAVDIALSLRQTWNVQRFPSINAALLAMGQGQTDGTLINIMTASALTQQVSRSPIHILLPAIVVKHVRLATLKGQQDSTRQAINSSLASSKASGRYNELIRYWHLYNMQAT